MVASDPRYKIYHIVSTEFVVQTTTAKKKHPQNCRCCFVIYYKLKKKCQLLQASKQTSNNHVVCVCVTMTA